MAKDRNGCLSRVNGEEEAEEKEKEEAPSKRNHGRKSKRKKEDETDDEDDSGAHEGDKKHSGTKKTRSSKRKSRRRHSDEDSSSLSAYSSDSEESDSDSDSESESSDYSSEESKSEDERRRRKRRERRKRKEREYEKERRRRKREREKEKERKRRKKEKERKKKKKRKEKDGAKKGAVTNSWGKYGIIHETDMWNKRPEFTAWLAEVKQVNLETLPNREEKEMFNDEAERVAALMAMNDPQHKDFEPTVFSSVDLRSLKFPGPIDKYVFQPYVSWARKAVRHETDVVMLTHLIIYFTTSVPSILYLFYNFTYTHAILHVVMQFYYTGTYTLMMHQHIHTRGILNKKFWLFDQAFPYLLDPMMGHTWNTYFYHHVKHHHVEGNGPEDLSSTVRYQRDDIFNFLHYVGRFYFFIWLDLPLYFLRKNRPTMALKAAASEFSTYGFYYLASRIDFRATVFAYLFPLALLRFGLMVGNWGQHAFVDPDEPDSDFRSSITLIDVASNRFCYNDGYHTSHHLNPLRHWRDHPVSFLQQKHIYAKESALVFHNIDYLMVTVRLMMKDYETLAKCLVPMGNQIQLTMEGRVELLKKLTRKFTEEQIREKFPQKK